MYRPHFPFDIDFINNDLSGELEITKLSFIYLNKNFQKSADEIAENLAMLLNNISPKTLTQLNLNNFEFVDNLNLAKAISRFKHLEILKL